MPEVEPRLGPKEQNIRSILILQQINDCSRFEQFEQSVRLKWISDGEIKAHIDFAIEDFLKAVDYYYENRDMEFAVNEAMRKPDGRVNVYSPHIADDVDRQVVVRIKNYIVPQVLEFAYLLLRSEQTKALEENPAQQ